jgi:hypothetical protein
MPYHANQTSFKPGHRPWSLGKNLSEDTKQKIRWKALQPEAIQRSIANLPPPMCKEANPSWHGGHYKSCAFCGELFWVIPSKENNAKYCSRQCRDLAQKKSFVGASNPHWRGGKLKKLCLICGKEFEVPPSHYKVAKYCSRHCNGKALSILVNSNPEIKAKTLQKFIGAMKGAKSEEHLRKIRKACAKKPSSIEARLIDIIRRAKLPFKYVGDGEVILLGLNPDFINTDGKKQLIELFSHTFHDPDCPKHFTKPIPWHQTELGRIMAYNSLGFKCLVIWEEELEDEKTVLTTIKKFMRSNQRDKKATHSGRI